MIGDRVKEGTTYGAQQVVVLGVGVVVGEEEGETEVGGVSFR